MTASTRPRLAIRFVAEFFVIAAGVLLALVGDEWRSSLGERQIARSYLERLSVDLELDLSTWTRMQDSAVSKDAALAAVQRWIDDPQYAHADLQALATNVAAGEIFATSVGGPRRATFDELLSTGSLNLIPDEQLRTELGVHYRDAEAESARFADGITGYHVVANQVVPREPPESLYATQAQRDLSMEELQLAAERMLGSDVRGLLISERNRASFLMLLGERRASRTQSLLEQIVRALLDMP